MDEQRMRSETGGEKGQKLARFDLIPPIPLERLAEQYGRGARKYEERNWERGYNWSLSYAAAMRHLNAFWAGEDYDDDDPLWEGDPPHHLDAAMFHLMALREFLITHPEYDDRPRPYRYRTNSPRIPEFSDALADAIGEAQKSRMERDSKAAPILNPNYYDTIGGTTGSEQTQVRQDEGRADTGRERPVQTRRWEIP